MTEFFAMGGKAWFVWPAYALGLLVIIYNIISPLRKHRRLLARLKRLNSKGQSS
jgi:heme exporter protein D